MKMMVDYYLFPANHKVTLVILKASACFTLKCRKPAMIANITPIQNKKQARLSEISEPIMSGRREDAKCVCIEVLI